MTSPVSSIADEQLFDSGIFERQQETPQQPITLFKNVLNRGNNYLDNEFNNGSAIEEVIYKRAWFIDQILIKAWEKHISTKDISLIAVGGYGRGELHPMSDVDILILIKSRRAKTITSEIESFITFLWDIGLQVGH